MTCSSCRVGAIKCRCSLWYPWCFCRQHSTSGMESTGRGFPKLCRCPLAFTLSLHSQMPGLGLGRYVVTWERSSLAVGSGQYASCLTCMEKKRIWGLCVGNMKGLVIWVSSVSVLAEFRNHVFFTCSLQWKHKDSKRCFLQVEKKKKHCVLCCVVSVGGRVTSFTFCPSRDLRQKNQIWEILAAGWKTCCSLGIFSLTFSAISRTFCVQVTVPWGWRHHCP